MNIDFSSVYPLADEILQVIINNFEKPKFLSETQEEASENLKKLYSEFEKTLSKEQKDYIEELESTNNLVESTNQIYWMLYGMKIHKKLHEVLNEMAENPANIVKYYDDKVKNSP